MCGCPGIAKSGRMTPQTCPTCKAKGICVRVTAGIVLFTFCLQSLDRVPPLPDFTPFVGPTEVAHQPDEPPTMPRPLLSFDTTLAPSSTSTALFVSTSTANVVWGY